MSCAHIDCEAVCSAKSEGRCGGHRDAKLIFVAFQLQRLKDGLNKKRVRETGYLYGYSWLETVTASAIAGDRFGSRKCSKHRIRHGGAVTHRQLVVRCARRIPGLRRMAQSRARFVQLGNQYGAHVAVERNDSLGALERWDVRGCLAPTCINSSASIMPEHRSCISTYAPSNAFGIDARFALMQRMKCGAQAERSSCSLLICSM